MSQTAPWRPMHTAPQTIDRIWLNHLTLGPILAEGRRGRWYAPCATHQVWRWYRPAEPDALEPFSGWLPYDAWPGERAQDAEATQAEHERSASWPLGRLGNDGTARSNPTHRGAPASSPPRAAL